jgi:predicted O-methyltransferase YrrM
MLPYTTWHSNTEYFSRPAGQEHYRLVAYIAAHFESGTCFADLGTSLGFSALALALNPRHKVLTYDITDLIPKTDARTVNTVPNIERRLENCLAVSALQEIVMCPFIVLDVDPHDGMQEWAMVQVLSSSGYKGVVLADDILLNENMRAFWRWVPQKKLDVTRYGHASGTGLIIFDEIAFDVSLEY